jgi:hypothetical protein
MRTKAGCRRPWCVIPAAGADDPHGPHLGVNIKAELGEADISGIAQDALRAELAHVRGLNQALDEGGFQRVEAMDAEEHVSSQGPTISSSGDVTACL